MIGRLLHRRDPPAAPREFGVARSWRVTAWIKWASFEEVAVWGLPVLLVDRARAALDGKVRVVLRVDGSSAEIAERVAWRSLERYGYQPIGIRSERG